MSLEKVRFGKDIIFECNVIDVDGRSLENWKCMRKDFPKVCRILNNKYGIDVMIVDRKAKEETKEFDWAK